MKEQSWIRASAELGRGVNFRADCFHEQQVCSGRVTCTPDRALGNPQALTFDRREQVIDGAVLGLGASTSTPSERFQRKSLFGSRSTAGRSLPPGFSHPGDRSTVLSRSSLVIWASTLTE